MEQVRVYGVIDRRPMMDVLIEVCARGRLNPATHTLVVPCDSGSGTVPFTASQSLQSLGVSSVRVVAKSQTSKPDQRFAGQPAAMPFEVRTPYAYLKPRLHQIHVDGYKF